MSFDEESRNSLANEFTWRIGLLLPYFVIFCIAAFIVPIFTALLNLTSSDLVELAKALGFGLTAFIVGVFSILFWALNAIGRELKTNSKIREASRIFAIRRQAIDEVFAGDPYSVERSAEIRLLKAHLLFSQTEISYEADNPASSNIFDYSEVLKALVKKS